MEQLAAEAAPRPSRRLRWTVGAALVVGGVAGLAAWGMTRPGALSYYMTPSEVAARGQAARGIPLRVGGRVQPGTMRRDGASVSFLVGDGHADLPVSYRGEVPDTLKEGTDVVAEGTLGSDGTLRATHVLAKCSSRYVPQVERQARASAAR